LTIEILILSRLFLYINLRVVSGLVLLDICLHDVAVLVLLCKVASMGEVTRHERRRAFSPIPVVGLYYYTQIAGEAGELEAVVGDSGVLGRLREAGQHEFDGKARAKAKRSEKGKREKMIEEECQALCYRYATRWVDIEILKAQNSEIVHTACL
jgi:hypothetical protein